MRAAFEPQGLFADGAVVDAGWSARIVGMLSQILAMSGTEIPAAFAFVRLLDPRDPVLQHPVRICSYFADYVQRTGQCGVIEEQFLGLFFGADPGSTPGSGSAAGAMAPMLANLHERLREWGLPVVQETILSFADHLWLDAGTLNLAADVRPAVAAVCRAFIESPSAAEARAWATHPLGLGLDGVRGDSIASPLSLRHLPQAIRHGQGGLQPGMEWLEAALALTPPFTRMLLKGSLALRERIVSRLRPRG